MSDFQNNLNQADDLLLEYSNVMHVWLMKIIGFYCLAFIFLNIYLNDTYQLIGTLITIPLLAITYLLFKKGFLLQSKIFNIVQIYIIISFLSILSGANSLMFLYFFPLIIATFILFQGEYKIIGYTLNGLMVVTILAIVNFERPLELIHLNPEHLKIDRFANVFGVAVLCILLLFFAHQSMDAIRQNLINQSHELLKKNNQLTAVVYTRDKMMSVISHDLRSPIIALHSAMNVFIDQDIDPKVQSEIISEINNKSVKLLAMVDDLLEWSKSQSESINCTIEKINVNHFKEYLKDLFHLIGATKKIVLDLNFKFNPETEFILCDRNLLEAVLRNLVSNAIKFSEEGSKLSITASDKNNKCEFSIQDYGRGLTPTQLLNIKSGNAFTTKGTANEIGYGLGLQLVKEFLHKQNSELYVESHEGFGSRFYFSLPFQH